MSDRNRSRDCKEGFKRIRMKLLQSERIEKARENMRQKVRELKKAGKEAAANAAANPRLMRLKATLKRKQDEEEAAKHVGPSEEEKLFNDRMYYDFMKEQKEARKRAELEERELRERLGNVSIMRAAELGNNTVVEKLIDAGEGKKPEPDHLFTPLHAACARGKLETVKYLVQDCKADFEARDKYGCTPVVRAAANGHMNVVKWLTETPLIRVDINTSAYWKATALHFAAEFGHVRMCEYLMLRKNMDVLAQTDTLETPYEVCGKSVRGEDKKEIEIELRTMFQPHIEMSKNMMIATLGSALDGISDEEAAMIHKISIADKVLNLHLEWEDDQLGEIREYENNVKMLFKFTREGKRVALDDVFNDPKICEIGSDIRNEKHGRSLLHIAAVDGDCDLAEVILDSTFLDPLDIDGKGRTGLHLAALYGHSNMVELMLDNASPAGPEGWEKLTSAVDNDGKTAAELLCQRWKPRLRDGARKPPESVVRAEKIRIRMSLEYLLDPDREIREKEEMKLLQTYENQVNLSKTYQQTGMKAPKWIRDNAKDINSKLGGMRAKQRKIESRKKRKLEFELKKKEREKLDRQELVNISKSARHMRDNLKKRLADIEHKQATLINWAETRKAELEPGLALANTRIAKENRFMELLHVRVASLASRNVSGGVSTMQIQVDKWMQEMKDQSLKEEEARRDWIVMDDAAKRDLVDTAAIEQLDIRLDACRERYEQQMQMMTVSAIGLEASLMPDTAILNRMQRIIETGVRVDWKATKRKGQNFMKAGKTITEDVSQNELKKIAAKAIEIKRLLIKDTKRLKHERQMIVDKQFAWDLRNANLWFDYADGHVNRRTAEQKTHTHREYQIKINVLEKQLAKAEQDLVNIQKHLTSEKEYLNYDIKRKWINVGSFASEHIGTFANLMARLVCYRWDIYACDAMLFNLEEDVEEGNEKISVLKTQIDDLRDEELKKHKDLKRESQEMLAMVRWDIGEEILEAKIEDAIQLPYVSDSDSGDGSAWDSDGDIIGGGSKMSEEDEESREEEDDL